MAWTAYVDSKNELWSVNRDLMYSLVRANQLALEVYQRTRFAINETKRVTWRATETDWSGLHQAVESQSRMEFVRLESMLTKYPGQYMQRVFSGMRESTVTINENSNAFRGKFQREIQQQINRDISNPQRAVEVLRVVRDLSAAALVTMAAPVFATAAGLPALALTMSGPILKGVAEWEETGSVGSAMMETTANMVAVIAGAGGQAGKVVIVFATTVSDASHEFGKTVVQGKDMTLAIERALTRALTTSASHLIPALPGIGNMAMAAVTKVIAVKTVAGTAGNYIADRIVGAVQSGPKPQYLRSSDLFQSGPRSAHFVTIPRVPSTSGRTPGPSGIRPGGLERRARERHELNTPSFGLRALSGSETEVMPRTWSRGSGQAVVPACTGRASYAIDTGAGDEHLAYVAKFVHRRIQL